MTRELEHAALDISALELFWELTGRLEAGETVTEADWAHLFHAPAYRHLFRVIYSAARLRPRLELAFTRGREPEAEIAADTDTLVEHYLKVRAQRAELQQFYRNLDLTGVLAEATRLAAEWLPADLVARGRLPGAAVLVYDVAMRGDEPILFDALFAYFLGEPHLVLAAGHAIYHAYCKQFQQPLPAMGLPELAGLVDMVTSMHGEGVADLINVERWIFQGGPVYAGGPLGNTRFVNRIREALHEAPVFLQRFDAALCAGLTDRGRAAAMAKAVTEQIPWASGHGPGFHMARKIVLAGLKDALTETAVHPIRFFELYARSCRALGEPCELSEPGLAFLRQLEHA